MGVLGFGGVLLCAGLLYFAVKTMGTDIPAAQAAGDSFLGDLKSDRVEAAYAKSTKAFQSGQTLEEFKVFLDRFSIFKTHTSKSSSGVHVFHGTGGKQATIKMTLISENNAMSCTLVLIEESGEWLVQKLTVP
jgi:hypothetical protein